MNERSECERFCRLLLLRRYFLAFFASLLIKQNITIRIDLHFYALFLLLLLLFWFVQV